MERRDLQALYQLICDHRAHEILYAEGDEHPLPRTIVQSLVKAGDLVRRHEEGHQDDWIRQEIRQLAEAIVVEHGGHSCRLIDDIVRLVEFGVNVIDYTDFERPDLARKLLALR